MMNPEKILSRLLPNRASICWPIDPPDRGGKTGGLTKVFPKPDEFVLFSQLKPPGSFIC